MNWSRFTDRFACFVCRKAFKPSKHHGKHAVVSRCPDCAGPVMNMGPDFKPPRRANVKAWADLAADPKPYYGRDGCRPPCCGRGGDRPKAERRALALHYLALQLRERNDV